MFQMNNLFIPILYHMSPVWENSIWVQCEYRCVTFTCIKNLSFCFSVIFLNLILMYWKGCASYFFCIYPLGELMKKTE